MKANQGAATQVWYIKEPLPDPATQLWGRATALQVASPAGEGFEAFTASTNAADVCRCLEGRRIATATAEQGSLCFSVAAIAHVVGAGIVVPIESSLPSIARCSLHCLEILRRKLATCRRFLPSMTGNTYSDEVVCRISQRQTVRAFVMDMQSNFIAETMVGIGHLAIKAMKPLSFQHFVSAGFPRRPATVQRTAAPVRMIFSSDFSAVIGATTGVGTIIHGADTFRRFRKCYITKNAS